MVGYPSDSLVSCLLFLMRHTPLTGVINYVFAFLFAVLSLVSVIGQG